MDILSHTFSGIAAVSATLPFTNFNKKEKCTALGIGAFVGAFPDLDAVSLWSKFGATGKDIYFGKLWYSHHAFNHSIFMGILLVGAILFFRSKRFKEINKSEIILSIGLLFGFLAHLFEDMPTPHCVWGGVRLFFPFDNYIGGTGQIWWWNNYDLFLLILSITITNLLIAWLIKKQVEYLTLLNTLSICVVFVFQVNSRQLDYNYIGYSTNYNELEIKSKEKQERILRPTLYKVMEFIDSKIPLNF